MSLPRPRAPAFILGAITILAGYLAIVYELALVVILFGFLVSLFTIALAVALMGRATLAGRREHAAEVFAGDPVDVSLAIVNVGAVRSAFFLDVEDEIQTEAVPPRGLVVSLTPAEEAVLRYRVVFPRRGAITPGKTAVASRFPFGFFERRTTLDVESSILVLPRPGKLRRDVLAETPVPQAEVPVAVRGGLGEFHGVREYRSDDNPRWIHWKTSARRGGLHVREFEREIDRRLIVALDPVGAKLEALDAAVSIAATLLDHYARAGYAVALAVTGESPSWVSFGAGADHVRRALRPLALAMPARSGGSPAWRPGDVRGAHVVRVTAGAGDPAQVASIAAVASSVRSIDAAEKPALVADAI